jgi:hypothetical protein
VRLPVALGCLIVVSASERLIFGDRLIVLTRTVPHAQILRHLREEVAKLEAREGYEASLQAAAKMVEDAAYFLAPLAPGTKVVELLKLATRLETIGEDPSLLGDLFGDEIEIKKPILEH